MRGKCRMSQGNPMGGRTVGKRGQETAGWVSNYLQGVHGKVDESHELAHAQKHHSV